MLQLANIGYIIRFCVAFRTITQGMRTCSCLNIYCGSVGPYTSIGMKSNLNWFLVVQTGSLRFGSRRLVKLISSSWLLKTSISPRRPSNAQETKITSAIIGQVKTSSLLGNVSNIRRKMCLLLSVSGTVFLSYFIISANLLITGSLRLIWRDLGVFLSNAESIRTPKSTSLDRSISTCQGRTSRLQPSRMTSTKCWRKRRPTGAYHTPSTSSSPRIFGHGLIVTLLALAAISSFPFLCFCFLLAKKKKKN